MSDFETIPKLERITRWRQLVLLAEIAGWLHDWGKMSQDFLIKHNRESGKKEKNDQKDRHIEIFNEDEKTDNTDLKTLLDFIGKPLSGKGGLCSSPTGLNSDQVTIRELIEKHHLGYDRLKNNKDKYVHLLWLLILADRMESAEDENNATAVQSETIYRSSSFGSETPLECIGQLDEIRENSYVEIARHLTKIRENGFIPGKPELRSDLWDCLQKKMKQGLGKTMRAVNDVCLDRHVWGVSSRFKAFVLRELLAQETSGGVLSTEIGNYSKRFCLLSIQWNYWELVTSFSRLVDLMARQQLVDEVQGKLTNLIEYEYALGNCIYRDDNGIHFLIAEIPFETDGDEPTWQEELKAVIFKEINDCSHGEIQAVILFEPTEYVTRLPVQMEKATRKLPEIHPPTWVQEWQNKSSVEICEVCHKRPVNDQQKICKKCAGLREKCIVVRKEKWKEEKNRPGETPWIGEIAGTAGKVAMLVARIGLEHWLDGDLLHTIFSTIPYDLRHQGTNEKGDEKGLFSLSPNPSWLDFYDYLHDPGDEPDMLGRLAAQKKDLRQWLKQHHGRDQILQDAMHEIKDHYGAVSDSEALFLAMTRKNPTAGRLLSIWQETEIFLESLGEDLTEQVQPRQRIVLKLVDRKSLKPGIFRIDLPVLGEIEVFLREDGAMQTITHIPDERLKEFSEQAAAWSGNQFILYPEESKQYPRGVKIQLQIAVDVFEAYYPCETITGSPNLMMAFVPAEHALGITEKWRMAYQTKFGKVQNRLPFSIGIIFMDEHYPMFAAMDAARRLVESFGVIDYKEHVARVTAVEKPGDEEPAIYRMHLASERFGEFTWDVASDLGDGNVNDWYYPYIKIKNGIVSNERSMSVNTSIGCWAHISNVQPDDEICFYPGLFDFIHLDSISRRLDAALNAVDVDRRRHPFLKETKSPRPLILQKMEQLTEIWDSIRQSKDMSESRYHAVTSLLAMKLDPWSQHDIAYRQLISNLVTLDFDQDKTIESAILDGTYFDVFELYRQILKQPVSSQ